jgi:hypothetical protein
MFSISGHKRYTHRWKNRVLFVVIINMLWISACDMGDNTPDVSDIKVELKSKRFDLELVKLDTNDLGNGLQSIKGQYPVFTDLFLDGIMGFRIQGNYNNDNPAIQQGLRIFLTDKDYRGLFDTVKAHYPDTKDVEKELVKGFQYMKHYYPNYKIPQNITYFISGLNNYGALLFGENELAIGLDMFLGDGYPFYRSVGLQDYLNVQFRKDYIPVAVFRNIYQDIHPDKLDDKTLLDLMLMRGKEQYFLSKVLPFKEEYERMAYTKVQYEDCEKNEGFIYNFFVQKDLLFSSKRERIFPFVNDGPFTREISDICPGNIGTWVGYRIILAYMKQHPETTMEELFKMDDSQMILHQAKYNPK